MTRMSDYATLGGAATLTGIPRSTIATAVTDGRLPAELTACGIRLVRVEDVRKLERRAARRKVHGKGRPRKLG